MYLICHVTSQDHLVVGSWEFMGGMSPIVECHHPEKFSDHRYLDSQDVMFLICHITSRDHISKALCEFMGRSFSL